MATNNAPKHDFAPAWLKIPNQENSKPPGTKQGKRFPSGPNSKFRHHSVDDDFYAYTYGPYDYYNGYGYPEKFGVHYTSQPSLLRTPGQRDSKYQHPHARYGPGQGMNVGYPSYYDFLPPYEYYQNDPYYNGTNNNYSARGSAKRSYYEKDGRSNSKEGKDKDEKKEKEGEKEKPFIDDFPSLNGGTEKSTSKGSKQVNGTGVWDNPPINKSGKSSEEMLDTSQANKVLRDANIFKNLVPNKSPSTPPIDILNTRFVTQPKTLSDKKSSFLKALRQEDNEKHIGKRGKSLDGELTNGINDLSLNNDDSNLSSSLEAEQRLLREMGWNEADEEEYEITEDDMKEFQNLSKQVQQHRNGIVKPIPKTWSPKHIPAYQPNVNDLNETLSSSDSDSDEAGN